MPGRTTDIQNAYGPELARAHAEGYGALAEAAARLLLGRLPPRVGRFIDLGCGAGALLSAFRGKTQDALGVDASEAMLDICRARLPEFSFARTDLFAAELPAADAAAATGEILSYAAAGADDAEGLAAAWFRNVYAALRPGGLFLFDALTDDGDFDYTRFQENERFSLAVQSRRDGREVAREIVVFLGTPEGTYRRAAESHRLRTFDAEELADLLADAGFVAERLQAYADFPLPQGRTGFLARKTGPGGGAAAKSKTSV